jgi:uncharacterized protein YjbI with pentapeptide repeats
MNRKELNEILSNHKKWLDNEEGGERADLSGAYLGGANLRDADFREANLVGANLRYADFREANLHGTILEGVKI